MKIKQIVKILETVDGFVPSDMKELDNVFYESKSQEQDYAVEDMDFVHFVRAFIKMNNYDSDLDKSVSDINHEEDIKQNYVRKDVYEMLFDKCDHLQERLADLHKRLEGKSYREVTAPRYVFSEIPNNDKGRRMIEEMRDTLNRSRYTMRVRGQHIKEEYKGTGATAYGQNIDQSTHLRVYIEEK